MNPLGLLRIRELLANARARRASDVHFGGADRVLIRIDGVLVRLDVGPIDDASVAAYLAEVLPPAAALRLADLGTADSAVRSGDAAPYRVHAYRQLEGVRVVVRLLAETVPALDTLGLPPVVATFATRPHGLVLFTGPTGSGKTTALAGLIDRINRTSERAVITIEDPVEYLHVSQRAIITHCEIGRDVHTYAEALRGAMRADPDVLLVGEMRDRETMEAAMSAAETGHLVFSTLHTNDAPQTIDRIIDGFVAEAQSQIRSQLAAVLHAVVSMRLVPRRSGTGRRAVAEVLVATDAVRAMIRDGKTHQLRNAIVTGRNAGMQTLETHLTELIMRNEITLEAAHAVSTHPGDIRILERNAG